MSADQHSGNCHPVHTSYLVALAALSAEGVFVFAADQSTVFINDAGRTMLGFAQATEPQHCLRYFGEHLYDGERQVLRDGQTPQQRIVRGETLTDEVVVYERPDHQRITLVLKGARLAAGEPAQPDVGLFFHVQAPEPSPEQVTRQGQRFEELAQLASHQAAQFNAVIAAIPDGMVVADEKGNLLQVNEAGKQILGTKLAKDLDQAVSHHKLRDLAGNTLRTDQLPMVRALKGELITNSEHIMYGSSGHETRVSVSASPIYSNQTIIGAVSLFRDVTQRRRYEEEREQRIFELEGLREIAQSTGLARTEHVVYGVLVRRLAHILQAGRCVVMLYDEEQGTFFARVPAYGFDSGQLDQCVVPLDVFETLSDSGQSAGIVLLRHNEGDQAAKHILEQFDATDAIMMRLAVRDRILGLLMACDQQNSQGFNEGHIRLLQTVGPQAALAIENSRLYTRERHSRAEAQARVSELARVNADLDAFTYTVSHDLRAPLRAIKGFSQLLERELGEMSDRATHHFNRIQVNVEKMSNLIEDLLAFSRTSRKAVDKQVVDTNQIVREAIRLYGQEVAQSNASVYIEDLPPLLGDSRLLEQVFVNLFSNAIKYQRDTVPLVLQVRGVIEANGVVIVVSDNGQGFDMRYHDHIFQVFQRLHSDDTYEGTGVGLALVKKIIERHNGRIWAESVVGKGTQFFVRLPALNEDQNEEAVRYEGDDD